MEKNIINEEVSSLKSADEDTIASDEEFKSDNSSLKAGPNGAVYFDAGTTNDGDGSQNNPYKYLRSERITSETTAYFKDGTYDIEDTFLISRAKFIGSGNTIINSIQTDRYDFIVAENSIFELEKIYFNNAHILNQGTLTANSAFFEGNRLFDKYFGGVIVCDSPVKKTTLTLDACGFESTYGAYKGGAISAINSDIRISNTRFIYYSATYKGGAIYCEDSDLNLYNVQFVPFTISSNKEFGNEKSNAYTSYYGGSIYCENSNVVMDRSNFIGSVAFSFGGCIASVNSTVNIKESNFNDSVSMTDGGGAIYSSKGNLKIFNSKFNNNSADFGGAICNINSVLNTNYTRYSNSLAKYYGGAIYDIYGTINLNRNWFYVSHAQIGGAIYTRIPNEFNLNNNYFGDSFAKQGSGIFFDGKRENINSNLFLNNTFDDSELMIPSEILRKTNYFGNDYHVFVEFEATLNGNRHYMISNPLYYQLGDRSSGPYLPYPTYEVFDDSLTMTIFDSDDTSRLTSVITSSEVRNITASVTFSNQLINPRLNFYVFEDINSALYNYGMDGNRYAGSREDLFNKFNLIGNYTIDLTGRTSTSITETCHVDFSNPFLNIKYDNLYEASSFYPASLINTTFLESLSIPTSGELLPYYNSNDYGLVSSIKNQKSGGNCWAFAGLATLETCLKKATGVTFDFSVENAKNLMASYSVFGLRLETNTGGYTSMLMSYLTSWLGPIDQSVEDYDELSSISLQDNPMFHIQNIRFLPARADSRDNDLYKLAIRDNGAVSVMFYWNGDYHAVSLVGWDDNYIGTDSVGNNAHGAWIFKNSWGEDWGNNGFGYLSYDEKISEQIRPDMHAYTFLFNDMNPYTQIYQYDFAGVTEFYHYENSVYLKNKFKATADGYLSAFSSYFDSQTDYTASVYKNDQFMFSQDGTSEAGYYTITFSTVIQLNEGDEFSIVLNNHNAGRNCVPVCSAEEVTKKTFNSNVSFISLDGENWFDLYDYADSCHVACIKAFMQNTTLRDINIQIKAFSTVNTRNFNVKVQIDDFDGISSLNYCLVKIIVDGKTHYAMIKDGIASLNLNLDNGAHTISAQYKDNIYKSNNVKFTFTVNKNQNSQSYNGLQDIINTAADKSEITLNRDYSYDENFDDRDYGVHINKTLTINGNGHVINGLTKATGFYISASNVILKNIVFKDLFSSGNGGAVYIAGHNLTLNNCSFINSKASANGGAIYSLFDINLKGCRFIENKADFGGGLYLLSSNASTIMDSTFTGNTANLHASAIYLEGTGDVWIKSANFTDNRAVYNGGAVMSNVPYSSFTDCLFENNSAKWGGAVLSNSKINDFTYSKFIKNTATISGGALMAHNTININDCEFIENTVTNNTEFLFGGFGGGAIYSFDKLNIHDSTFMKNHAHASGGAIYTSKYLNVYNSKFINNNALKESGAVHNDIWQMSRSNMGILKFSEAKFFDCLFEDNYGPYGGAIDNAYSITNCTFVKNAAKYNGGAVYVAKNVDTSKFINNTADIGGAIYSEGKIISISGSHFTNNNASYGGAIITNGEFVITSSNFTKNHAYTSGGTLYLDGKGTLRDLNLIDNNATYGGALYLGESGSFSIENSNFISNSVSEFGGAIFIYSSSEETMADVKFTSCRFIENNAERSGGAIYTDGKTSIISSEFENNIAQWGNSIYARAYLDLINTNIKSNDDLPIYFAAHYNEDDSFYGNLYLKNNVIDANIGIFYTNDELKSTSQFYLVFHSDKIVKGENISIAHLEDDNANLIKVYGMGDLYLTLIDQNNAAVKVTLKYDMNLCNYYLDTTQIPYGIYRLSGSLSKNHPGSYSQKQSTLYITDKAGRLPVSLSGSLTKTYGTSNGLIIIVKDSYGNVIPNALISINLNGRTSQIKTNAKGQAILGVNLAPNTYGATVTFNGNDMYLKSSIKTTVIVKKAIPKITASKKTYKLKAKTKKYTITLKNNLGKAMKKVKVTLKVKGKKYTAKTNSKGKATFKLKLKKKGNFKATITYAGNAYYNKVTKSVKIKVKK